MKELSSLLMYNFQSLIEFWMNTNQQMRLAQRNKKDEFYTQFEDIEKELVLYKEQFRGKVVYLPCDTKESEFYRFFSENFSEYGLKKLYATAYENEFGQGEFNEFDGNIYSRQFFTDKLDFRSDYICGDLFKEADIIITNPPFSLFREFITKCILTKKQFIVIGNMNSILTKDIFGYIANNELWWGVTIHSGDRLFRVPDDYPVESTNWTIENGIKYIRVKGVRWYTNMHPDKPIENQWKPTKKFSEITKQYFQYMPDILCIDKTSDIPYDYDEPMGVPLTYFDKHNPELFDIIDGVNRYLVLDNLNRNEEAIANKYHLLTVNGKVKYFRIIIKKK